MYATHEAELNLPTLPKAARHIYIVPELDTCILISVGHLCDNNCKALFEKTKVTIFHDGRPVLTGSRNGPNQLWHLDPYNDKSSSAMLATELGLATRPSFLPAVTPTADIVAFHHAALGSPTISTLHQAIKKGYVHNFPGLNVRTLRNHTPFSTATIKGHQDSMRKNVQSTKPSPPKLPQAAHDTASEIQDNPFPSSDDPNVRTKEIYAQCLDISGKAYSDLTGEFIIPSSRGNKYVLVFYDYNSNHIFAEPLKSRTANAITTAHITLLNTLTKAGLTPNLLILDNECPALLKDHLKENKIDFQLVPPHQHRRNAAEQAIRTWKNHFLAILCSTDDGFPLHLWDRLLPQANLTLNLLRGSRINPRLSAWAQVYGSYDYNRTPIAPPGTRVLAHEPSTVRGTWAPRAKEGWYVGPALDSYRCFCVWMDDTRHTRIVEKCTWFPTKVRLPVPTTSSLITEALQALANVLAHQDTQDLIPNLNENPQ